MKYILVTWMMGTPIDAESLMQEEMKSEKECVEFAAAINSYRVTSPFGFSQHSYAVCKVVP